MMTLQGYRSELLSVPVDPAFAGSDAPHHEQDGLLIVHEGVIVARGDYSTLFPRFPGLVVEDLGGKLIVPGFVDTHIHYPQVDSIASHGEQLLEWLERHIFPAESRFSERTHADQVAAFFLDELLRNGTTSALVFATVHKDSVEALFEAALIRNMRIISGKVLMDLGPADLHDTPESGLAESQTLITRWRGRGRLGYAVTPRFALTSSDAQLQGAGDLLTANPDVLLHTHLSENRGEIAAIAARFPQERDYLDVYDRFGLVGPRSVFAHGIHLDDRALSRMAHAGAGIAFCPSSNLFLGSGLFDLEAITGYRVGLGIGTDVGAGTSFSMLSTLGEAYKVCQMRGQSLDPFRALHLATAGGARLLGLQDRIGSLTVGQEADFVVLDTAATPLLARRTEGRPLADRLFALQILGDDRAIHSTYIAGHCAYVRGGAIGSHAFA